MKWQQSYATDDKVFCVYMADSPDAIEEHARLKKAWQLWWSPEDGASTVLPGDGGIHRVGNPGEGVAVSVHLYGSRIGEVDGRDYDPSRDYVCDRRED